MAWTWVGERGPELVRLPPGSRVIAPIVGDPECPRCLGVDPRCDLCYPPPAIPPGDNE